MASRKTKKQVQALAKRGKKLVKEILRDPLVKELMASEKRLLKKTIDKAVKRAKKKISK